MIMLGFKTKENSRVDVVMFLQVNIWNKRTDSGDLWDGPIHATVAENMVKKRNKK